MAFQIVRLLLQKRKVMSNYKQRLWELRCKLRLHERLTTSCWRWRSLLSRSAVIKRYLAANASKKLQIGCGKNPLTGWLNTDLLANQNVVYMDATKPLPFSDNSLDYIYSEHIFEHINYQAGSKFLKESHRVLKPGGRIRIATPDMAFLIRLYSQSETDISKRYFKHTIDRFVQEPKFCARAVVVNNFFYSWGHQFIYDFETLDYTLRNAGFLNTIQVKPQESADHNLRNLESHGKILGEEFNLLETIVVEAEKASP